jgi:hypothetical protein
MPVMPPQSLLGLPAVRTGLAALLLAILTVSLFLPLLFGGQVLYFGDIGLYFVPLLHFQRTELLAGRIPLWNPYLFCGTPFVGNPQAWPLYPSSLLLYALSAPVAVGIIGTLHIFWASLGMLLFLRQRGHRLGPAVLGGVAFGFGGALVSKMQFPNMVQAMSYLPWLLWALDRTISIPTTGRAGAFALLVGLAILAAHPQIFLMQFYLCLAYALWRFAPLDRAARSRAAWMAVAALCLGVALAAAYLLPTLEMALASVRDHLTLRLANRIILPPYAALTNFVLPNFYGNPATDRPYVARGNFWEPCCYAGVLPFVLAVAAMLLCFRHSGETRFWMTAALCCVWLAMGKAAGLYAVAFYVLPGVSKFHDPARFLHPATFAMAVLAAQGAESLLAAPRLGRARFAATAALLLLSAADLLAFVRTLNPVLPAGVYAAAAASPRLPGERRVYHADVRAVWHQFISYKTYAPVRDEAGAAAFLGSLAPNLPMLAGRRDVYGYDPVRLADPDVFFEVVRRGGAPPDAAMRFLGADALITLDASGNAVVETVPGASRARLSPGRGGRARPSTPLAVRDENPQRVVVELPDRHEEGLVILADTDCPGWRAKIDGIHADILPANGIFRGVYVPKSARRVVFRYTPSGYRIGMFLSLTAAGILAGILIAASIQSVKLACPRRGDVAREPTAPRREIG